MLQVDRGYLMVIDVGGRRHVKALKVVGFTDTTLNTLATERLSGVEHVGATGGEGQRGPGCRGTVDPKPKSIGDSDPRVSGSREGAAAFTGGVAEQWISTVTDMVDFYAPFTVDVCERFGRVVTAAWRRRTTPPASSSASPVIGRSPGRRGSESIENWGEVTVRPTSGADPGRSAEHRGSTRR